jgi:F-type H+-transporting ATPase subunit alpha
MLDLAGSLRLDYAQFLELEVFARFGQVLDARTERGLEHGRRLRAVLQQPQSDPHDLAAEVALLQAVHDGLLDTLPTSDVTRFKRDFGREFRAAAPELCAAVDRTGELDEAGRRQVSDWLQARVRALGAPKPA